MVDRTDLGHVNSLYHEAGLIRQALRNFDEGGMIVQLTVSPAGIPPEALRGPPPVPGVTVSTVGITYPPQMVTAIQEALKRRENEIMEELAGLGLSGVETTPQSAAAPVPPSTGRPPPHQPHQPHRR